MRPSPAPFPNPQGLPLLALVLIPSGADEPEPSRLEGLGFPVTVALDPAEADAGENARVFRAAGSEVVTLGAPLLPGHHTARDFEIAVTAAADVAAQALGALNGPGGGFAAGRPAPEARLPTLPDDGPWLLPPPDGPKPGGVAVKRGGILTASIFHAVDGDAVPAEEVAQALARASREATRTGSAVLVVRAGSETIDALRA